jgi:hypothetical protein
MKLLNDVECKKIWSWDLSECCFCVFGTTCLSIVYHDVVTTNNIYLFVLNQTNYNIFRNGAKNILSQFMKRSTQTLNTMVAMCTKSYVR